MLARDAGLKEDSLLHRFMSGLLPDLQQEVWRKELCSIDEIASFCEYWLSCNDVYRIDETNCYDDSRYYCYDTVSDYEYDEVRASEWLAWQDSTMCDSAYSPPADHWPAEGHTTLQQLALQCEELEHRVLQQREENVQLRTLLI